VIGLLLLALQAEAFDGLFGVERGAVWTYTKKEGGAEAKVVLTLLRKEPGRLTFDEKELRDGRSDPRAVLVVLSIADGFLTLERRIDDEPTPSLRLLKIGAKEGDSWDGGRRLKDDGTSIRTQAGETDFWLSPEKGVVRIEKPGSTIALAEVAKTPWTLVSLSARYNATLTKAWHPPGVPDSEFNDLSSLPRGVQTLDEVPFDCRGILQLAGRQAPAFPEKAEGIEVGTAASRLHVLHATGWSAAPGATVASFTVHFKDGKQAEIPVVFGDDVSDWWQYPAVRFRGTKGKAVWVGSNPAARANGASLKLYKTSWENPRPEVEIVRVDYVSRMTTAAPFLIAVTAEKK
jgi:hypothetical protein